jgi:hypothetical protein
MDFTNEKPRYEVENVRVKNGQLTVDFKEHFAEANYSNNVTKASEQYIHSDLKYALNLLKPHVAAICEMREADRINVDEPSEDDLINTLEKIIITGYSISGKNESAGAAITAQRLLKTGHTLNIKTPCIKFEDETDDGYRYGTSLKSVIERCNYEVDAYLFEQKWGMKQLSLDFDFDFGDGETGDGVTGQKPKKRGRKKKLNIVAADDAEVESQDDNIPDVEFEEMPL